MVAPDSGGGGEGRGGGGDAAVVVVVVLGSWWFVGGGAKVVSWNHINQRPHRGSLDHAASNIIDHTYLKHRTGVRTDHADFIYRTRRYRTDDADLTDLRRLIAKQVMHAYWRESVQIIRRRPHRL